MLGGLMDVVKDASSAVIPGSSKPSGLTTRTSTTTTTIDARGMLNLAVPPETGRRTPTTDDEGGWPQRGALEGQPPLLCLHGVWSSDRCQ